VGEAADVSAGWITNAIARERARQETLKAEGRFRYTLADKQMGDAEKVIALLEEVAEVGKAVMGQRMLVGDGGDLRKELVQVAACAVAWLECLGRDPVTNRGEVSRA
jgi:hypothetical protein